MAAQTYPTVGSKVGQYNFANWATIFNARFDENYMEEISRYGLGSHFMDFLQLADYTTSITNRNPKLFETLEWENTVKVGTEIAVSGSPGDPISFDIHADDIDAQGQIPVQVNDGLVLPGYYEENNRNAIYVITDITTNTVTAEPLSADGTGGSAVSEVAIAVPVGTVLKVHSNYWGYGTGQPTGENSSRAVRTYTTQIVKTSMNYEGGIQAIKWRDIPTENGVNSAWMDGQELAEMKHSKKIDDILFLGEVNDNSALTQASQFGGTNSTPATKGLWNWGEEAGQDLLFAGQWDGSNLYDYKDLAISQNVIAREVLFLMGTDLQRMVEESNLDWIKSFSGGSDLFRTAFEIGIDVRSFKANGYHFLFQELRSFANPLRWGNKEYDFTKYGLMIPNGMETYEIDGKMERHPQLIIGYLNHAGEDRSRIVRLVDGLSGRETIATNQYDGSNLWMLSELATIFYRPNQIVRVLPQ
jgi:hypothetical protein